MSAKCPNCNYSMQFSRLMEINHLVICSNCGVELEVVWLYPLTLAMNSRSNPDLDSEEHRKNKFKKGR